MARNRGSLDLVRNDLHHYHFPDWLRLQHMVGGNGLGTKEKLAKPSHDSQGRASKLCHEGGLMERHRKLALSIGSLGICALLLASSALAWDGGDLKEEFHHS